MEIKYIIMYKWLLKVTTSQTLQMRPNIIQMLI